MDNDKKEFAVIGLGRFGSSLAQYLYESGAKVMGIDCDESVVNDAVDYTTTAMLMDATSQKAMDQVGLQNFDAVIVAVAHEQVSIMISLLAVEKGAKKVIAKTRNDLQTQVLYKIGVTECVYPERDSGRELAARLVTSNILRSIELSDEYGTAELAVAREWAGLSLMDLQFRNKYGLNIIAIRSSDGHVNINPEPGDLLSEQDVVLVIGSTDAIRDLEKRLETGRL